MDRELLIEIGCEEIPASWLPGLTTQVGTHLEARLKELRLTPEESMRVQSLLGADVAMAFDECPPGDGEAAVIDRALRRTTEDDGHSHFKHAACRSYIACE